MRRLRARDDEGSLMIEVVVGSAISLGVLAFLGVLFLSTFNVDAYAQQDHESLSQLRAINDRVVKELRQAGKIYIESYACGSIYRSVRFWVDSDSDGLQEAPEQITWTVSPVAGDKARITRGTGVSTATTLSEDLVWNDAVRYFDYNVAVPSCAPATLPDPSTVTVRLEADIDPDRYAASRVVHTEVKLRNVPD